MWHQRWTVREDSAAHLGHLVGDVVVELASHAQVHPELVQLRRRLRVHVDAAQVLLHLGRRDLRLHVDVTV